MHLFRFFAVVFCLSLSLSTDAEEKLTPVKIGVIIPLSGAHAVYGEDAKNLTGLIVDDLNQASSKYRYEFILEDGNCGVGNSASTATKKLININKVSFIIYGCSGEVLQGGPIANKSKVVGIAYAASHPDVSKVGEYIFRGYVDIRKGTQLIADLILKETKGKVGIITEESSFTSAIRDVLEEQLKGREVATVDFQVDETDFKSGLLKLSSAGVRAIYINPNSPRTYVNIVRQMLELGIKAPLYSYFAPGDADSLKILGKSQDGVKFIDIYEGEARSKGFEAVYVRYLKKHPAGPRIPYLLQTSYSSILGLTTAIEAVGPNPEKVKDRLITTEFIGAAGPTKFDKNRELEGHSFEVKIIEEGKPHPF